jgi:hypothetical protein
MTEGIKYDTGKTEYGLIPPHALDEVAKVLTYGAQKYSRDNWKGVPDKERRYFDAALRHVWSFKRGENLDKETGLHHLAHAVCCLLYLAEFDLDPAFKAADHGEISAFATTPKDIV